MGLAHAPVNANIPAATKALVQTQSKQIAAGKLHPFTGPLKDNSGKTRWESGPMSDAALSQMDYLVEGVVGAFPK
jgi:simple sugar transport system substrate-binding protein